MKAWLECVKATHSARSNQPVVLPINQNTSSRVFQVELLWNPERAPGSVGPTLNNVKVEYTIEPLDVKQSITSQTVTLGDMRAEGRDAITITRPTQHAAIHGVVRGLVNETPTATRFYIPANPVRDAKAPSYVTRSMIIGENHLDQLRIDRTFDEPESGPRNDEPARWSSVPHYVFDRGVAMHPSAPERGRVSEVQLRVPEDAHYFVARFMAAGKRCGPHYGNLKPAVVVFHASGHQERHELGDMNSVNEIPVFIDVRGAAKIALEVDPMDSHWCDKAAWAEARFAY